MIRVRSLLKVGDRFIPLNEVMEPVSDPLYVYGAIDLVLGDAVVLDAEYWDLVDQLWSYFVNMLLEVEAKGEAKTFFADHPTRIRWRGDRRAGFMLMEVGEPAARRGSCGYEEFFVGMCAEARHLFGRMRELNPGSTFYDTALGQLDDLQQRWPAVAARNGST